MCERRTSLSHEGAAGSGGVSRRVPLTAHSEGTRLRFPSGSAPALSSRESGTRHRHTKTRPAATAAAASVTHSPPHPAPRAGRLCTAFLWLTKNWSGLIWSGPGQTHWRGVGDGGARQVNPTRGTEHRREARHQSRTGVSPRPFRHA